MIHYNRLTDGVIYLLVIYAKGVKDSIPAKTLTRFGRRSMAKLSEKALRKRDAARDIGAELLASVRAMRSRSGGARTAFQSPR